MRKFMLPYVLLAAFCVASIDGVSAQEFPAGKQIRIIVPFASGGGTDTFARLIGEHLGRHVAGQPEVVVENVSGSGWMAAANSFAARSDGDGRTTLLAASGHLNLRAFLGVRGLNLKLDDIEPLIAVPMGHVTAISGSLGLQRPKDLLHLKSRPSKGINDPIGQFESLIALELLGVGYRPVPGFAGRGDTRQAFERGELGINTQATPVYLASVTPLVRSGKATPLYAIGFIDAEGLPMRDPAVPEMITAPELYESIHGRKAQGPEWEAYKAVVPLVQDMRGTIWMHSAAPARARAALKAGIERMLVDPDFAAAADDVLDGYALLHGAELARATAAVKRTPAAVLNHMRDLLRTRYGVEFSS